MFNFGQSTAASTGQSTTASGSVFSFGSGTASTAPTASGVGGFQFGAAPGQLQTPQLGGASSAAQGAPSKPFSFGPATPIANSSSGMLTSQVSSTPQASFKGFGIAQQQQQGVTSSPSLFGTPPTAGQPNAGGGLFGAPSSAGAPGTFQFGKTTTAAAANPGAMAQSQPAGGSFGFGGIQQPSTGGAPQPAASSSGALGGGSLFGVPAASAPTSSLTGGRGIFGSGASSTTTTTGMSAGGGGLFGTGVANTALPSSNAASGPATSSIFGATAAATSSAAPPASASGGLFSGSSTAAVSSAPVASGGAATLFGNAAAKPPSAGAFGSGLFGTATSAPGSGGLFGNVASSTAPASSGGGGFLSALQPSSKTSVPSASAVTNAAGSQQPVTNAALPATTTGPAPVGGQVGFGFTGSGGIGTTTSHPPAPASSSSFGFAVPSGQATVAPSIGGFAAPSATATPTATSIFNQPPPSTTLQQQLQPTSQPGLLPSATAPLPPASTSLFSQTPAATPAALQATAATTSGIFTSQPALFQGTAAKQATAPPGGLGQPLASLSTASTTVGAPPVSTAASQQVASAASFPQGLGGTPKTPQAVQSAQSLPTGSTLPAQVVGGQQSSVAATVGSTPVTAVTLDYARRNLASLTHSQLEEVTNKWRVELEEQEREFLKKATLINAWDRLLVDNGQKMTTLMNSLAEVTTEQDRVEQDLDFITVSQDEMESVLRDLEGQLASSAGARYPSYAETQRQHMVELAMNIDSQLRQINMDIFELREALPGVAASSIEDPMQQIAATIKGHVDSLEDISKDIVTLKKAMEDGVSQMKSM